MKKMSLNGKRITFVFHLHPVDIRFVVFFRVLHLVVRISPPQNATMVLEGLGKTKRSVLTMKSTVRH